MTSAPKLIRASTQDTRPSADAANIADLPFLHSRWSAHNQPQNSAWPFTHKLQHAKPDTRMLHKTKHTLINTQIHCVSFKVIFEVLLVNLIRISTSFQEGIHCKHISTFSCSVQRCGSISEHQASRHCDHHNKSYSTPPANSSKVCSSVDHTLSSRQIRTKHCCTAVRAYHTCRSSRAHPSAAAAYISGSPSASSVDASSVAINPLH